MLQYDGFVSKSTFICQHPDLSLVTDYSIKSLQRLNSFHKTVLNQFEFKGNIPRFQVTVRNVNLVH